MALQFRKSITICKGIKLNITKTGIGVTVGTKGCQCSINSSGRTTTTVGVPGTELYYSESKNSKTKKKEAEKQKQKALKEQEKKLAKEAQLQQDANTVAQYEEYIHAIQRIHLTCEPPIDWEGLAKGAAPFEEGKIGPNESAALDAYNAYQPSFTDKLLHKSEIEAKEQALAEAITAARQQDMELMENWKEMRVFADEVLKGNIDAFLDVIEEANPFETMLNFGSDFQFGTETAERMEIEFRVKSENVVPIERMSLTKAGHLSVKEMPKTQYYDILQDYVCSCVIRLGREIFAMLPVKYVYVHAVDSQLNTGTGHEEEMDILSVGFEREKFEAVNFERIDPSDFIGTFPNRMAFKKASGFSPIERLA